MVELLLNEKAIGLLIGHTAAPVYIIWRGMKKQCAIKALARFVRISAHIYVRERIQSRIDKAPVCIQVWNLGWAAERFYIGVQVPSTLRV